MEKKNIIDKRVIKLENILKEDYIPFLEGRPKREKVVGTDDLLNLQIALHTAKSLDEFLSKV